MVCVYVFLKFRRHRSSNIFIYLFLQKVDSVVLKNAFARTIIDVQSLDAGQRKDTELSYADRHWVDTFQSSQKEKSDKGGEEEEEEENKATGHLQLSFQRNVKVYVLYFTTEPRNA